MAAVDPWPGLSGLPGAGPSWLDGRPVWLAHLTAEACEDAAAKAVWQAAQFGTLRPIEGHPVNVLCPECSRLPDNSEMTEHMEALAKAVAERLAAGD